MYCLSCLLSDSMDGWMDVDLLKIEESLTYITLYQSEDECISAPLDPKPHPVATAQDNLFPILPEFNVNSHISPIMGSHSAITDGIYVITFDNSYSK